MAEQTEDVVAELNRLDAEMQQLQQALFAVGLASVGTSIGNWRVQLDRINTWHIQRNGLSTGSTNQVRRPA
jgi:hypothetical protein